MDTAIRIYLREELERAKLTLAHVPDSDPRAQPIRGLHQEAFRQLSSERLLDAIITVRDLREAIIEFEGLVGIAPPGPGIPPASPPPEVADAATKRARELVANSGSSSGNTNP